jgi:hypothetical protein
MNIQTFYGKKNWKKRLLEKLKGKSKRRRKRKKLNMLLNPLP